MDKVEKIKKIQQVISLGEKFIVQSQSTEEANSSNEQKFLKLALQAFTKAATMIYDENNNKNKNKNNSKISSSSSKEISELASMFLPVLLTKNAIALWQLGEEKLALQTIDFFLNSNISRAHCAVALHFRAMILLNKGKLKESYDVFDHMFRLVGNVEILSDAILNLRKLIITSLKIPLSSIETDECSRKSPWNYDMDVINTFAMEGHSFRPPFVCQRCLRIAAAEQWVSECGSSFCSKACLTTHIFFCDDHNATFLNENSCIVMGEIVDIVCPELKLINNDISNEESLGRLRDIVFRQRKIPLDFVLPAMSIFETKYKILDEHSLKKLVFDSKKTWYHRIILEELPFFVIKKEGRGLIPFDRIFHHPQPTFHSSLLSNEGLNQKKKQQSQQQQCDDKEGENNNKGVVGNCCDSHCNKSCSYTSGSSNSSSCSSSSSSSSSDGSSEIDYENEDDDEDDENEVAGVGVGVGVGFGEVGRKRNGKLEIIWNNTPIAARFDKAGGSEINNNNDNDASALAALRAFIVLCNLSKDEEEENRVGTGITLPESKKNRKSKSHHHHHHHHHHSINNSPSRSQQLSSQEENERNGVGVGVIKNNNSRTSNVIVPLSESKRRKLLNLLNCPICDGILIEPVTIRCGHSFCRICLADAITDLNNCPICGLKISRLISPLNGNVNLALSSFICSSFYAETVQARQLKYEFMTKRKLDYIPLIVCTVLFPTITTPICVSEARYRLMIRRCLECGEKIVGICAPANTDDFCGNVPSGCATVGTAAEIIEISTDNNNNNNNNNENLDSVYLKVTGRRRFSILETIVVDGYTWAKYEWYDDDEPVPNFKMQGNAPTVEGDFWESITPLHTFAMEILYPRIPNSLELEVGLPPPKEFPDALGFWIGYILPVRDTVKYAILQAPCRLRMSMLTIVINSIKDYILFVDPVRQEISSTSQLH